MTISSELNRIQNAKASIKAAIEDKGVPVDSSLRLDGYAEKIGEISGGGGEPWKITDTSFLFYKSARLGKQEELLSHTENVTIAESMYEGAGSGGVDGACKFYPWDSSSVTTFRNAFKTCWFSEFLNDDGTTPLVGISQHVENLDTSSAQSFESMFEEADPIYGQHIDLSGYDTSNIVTYYRMFMNMNLADSTLDLSSFVSDGSQNTEDMFYHAESEVGAAGVKIIFGGDSIFVIDDSNVEEGHSYLRSADAIYVPDALVNTYKADSVWSVVADKIRPVSEYENA